MIEKMALQIPEPTRHDERDDKKQQRALLLCYAGGAVN